MFVGGADFYWMSDYAQFLLVDAADLDIQWITEVPPERFERGYHVAPNALVVYTADCMRQVIQIHQYDSHPDFSPTEALCADAWTKSAETAVALPSGTRPLQRDVVAPESASRIGQSGTDDEGLSMLRRPA